MRWVNSLAVFFSIRFPMPFWNLLSFLRFWLASFRYFFPDLLFTKVFDESCVKSNQMALLGKQKAAVFCVHSFQLSGAELYALDCARIAKSNGFTIVWLVDYFHLYECNKAVFFEISELFVRVSNRRSPLVDLCKLVEANDLDVSIIHIHHSVYSYVNLPYIRSVFYESKIIDSTHIIEMGGRGFPRLSVKYSEYIDIHNVISSGLSDYYLSFGVKNVLRTVISPTVFSYTFPSHQRFVIKIVGRLCFQKRSYLIPAYVNALSQALSVLDFHVPVDLIIVGDGVFKKRLQLMDFPSNINVLFTGNIISKSEIYNNANLIVQLSENEGVSVVSYECAQLKIPILATNVGQQSESVHSDMLLPVHPTSCIRKAVKKTVDLILSPDSFSHVLNWQYENIQALKFHYDFHMVLSEVYKISYEK